MATVMALSAGAVVRPAVQLRTRATRTPVRAVRVAARVCPTVAKLTTEKAGASFQLPDMKAEVRLHAHARIPRPADTGLQGSDAMDPKPSPRGSRRAYGGWAIPAGAAGGSSAGVRAEWRAGMPLLVRSLRQGRCWPPKDRGRGSAAAGVTRGGWWGAWGRAGALQIRFEAPRASWRPRRSPYPAEGFILIAQGLRDAGTRTGHPRVFGQASGSYPSGSSRFSQQGCSE